jgi:hypothetical protein
MPKQPEGLVIRILPDIQGTLAEHTKTLADHTKGFGLIEQRLDDVNEGMVTALGLASHAHVRDEKHEERYQRP